MGASTIKDYVELKRRERTARKGGAPDTAHPFRDANDFHTVLERTAEAYGEEADAFSEADEFGLNRRQVVILAAVLGLNDHEFKDFEQFVRVTGGMTVDFNPVPALATVKARVEEIIANLHPDGLPQPTETPSGQQSALQEFLDAACKSAIGEGRRFKNEAELTLTMEHIGQFHKEPGLGKLFHDAGNAALTKRQWTLVGAVLGLDDEGLLTLTELAQNGNKELPPANMKDGHKPVLKKYDKIVKDADEIIRQVKQVTDAPPAESPSGPRPIQEYLDAKLVMQIGAGRRFVSLDHFMDVFDKLAETCEEPVEALRSPDAKGLTFRQAILLSALIGQTEAEFQELLSLIQEHRKLRSANMELPVLRHADALKTANAIVASLAPDYTPGPGYDSLLALASEETAELPTHTPPPPPPPSPPLEQVNKQKRKSGAGRAEKKPATPLNGYILMLMEKNIGPGKRFEDEASFKAILEQAAEYFEQDVKNVCQLGITPLINPEVKLISAVFGLSDASNELLGDRVSTGSYVAFSKLAAQQYPDTIVRQKLSSRGDVNYETASDYVNQVRLERFVKALQASPSEADRDRFTHRFLDLLYDRSDLPARNDLLKRIIKESKIDEATAGNLVAAVKGWRDKTQEPIRLSEDAARIVATFTFPDDKELQERTFCFLGALPYKAPTVETAPPSRKFPASAVTTVTTAAAVAATSAMAANSEQEADIREQESALLAEERNKGEMSRILSEETVARRGFESDLRDLGKARAAEGREKEKQGKPAEQEGKRQAAEKRKQEQKQKRAQRQRNREDGQIVAERRQAMDYRGGGEETKRDERRRARAAEAAQAEHKRLEERAAGMARLADADRTNKGNGTLPHARRTTQAKIKTPKDRPSLLSTDEILNKSLLDNPEGGKLAGTALLHYARTRKNEEGGLDGLTFGQLLAEMHERAGVSKVQLATALGIDKAQYAYLERGDSFNKPEILRQIAGKLGAQTDEDKIEWCKFILGIPQEHDQNTLNQLIDAETRKTDYAYGQKRTIELARFFKLLGGRHGLTERSQLALSIANHANLDSAVATEIQTAISNMAGPRKNAEIDPDTLPSGGVDKEHRTKTMSAELANLVAAFAFPDDLPRQEACNEFLTSDKYKTPTEVEAAHKSIAMKDIRAQRGSSWGARTKKTSNTELSR